MNKYWEEKRGKNKTKEEKNKGFSLVELIVVIAILAILAVVIAPQIMKYIGKSRDAADQSNMALCKTTVSTALADEEVYNEVAGGTASTITVKFDGAPVAVTTYPKLTAEVNSILGGDAPEAEVSGHDDGFKVDIKVDTAKNEVLSVTVGYVTP